jgi:formimidoylglutamate deiminase
MNRPGRRTDEAAAGFPAWELRPGARADLLLVDAEGSALAGVPTDAVLDALVFYRPTRPMAGVMVAGHWVIAPRTGVTTRGAPGG